tara:strand:- start:1364 stop:1501 length:138 start_codon:yes stop_codon:yes gene_type:complete
MFFSIIYFDSNYCSWLTGNGAAMASRAGKETFRFRLVCEPKLFVL